MRCAVRHPKPKGASLQCCNHARIWILGFCGARLATKQTSNMCHNYNLDPAFLFASYSVFLFAVRVCLFVVLRRSVRAVLLLHRDGVGVLRTVLLLRMASARMLFVIFVGCGTLCLCIKRFPHNVIHTYCMTCRSVYVCMYVCMYVCLYRGSKAK